MRRTLLGYAGRSLALWILVRAVLTVFLSLARDTPVPGSARSPLLLSPLSAALVPLLVTALLLLDVRALRERVFLANIGIGLHLVALTALLSATLLELAAGLVLVLVT